MLYENEMNGIDFINKMEVSPRPQQLDQSNNKEQIKIDLITSDHFEYQKNESESTLKSSNPCTKEWYFVEPPELSDCPFKSFHHTGLPSEFLHYPSHLTNDKKSKHILAAIDDHTSGICMKIQFIVNNLKDCQGVWPQLFLQKLNAIIVHADPDTVRVALSRNNFNILKDLINYYANEPKCEMVYRYWCLFYNAFTKNLVPVIPYELKNQLMIQLQTDFSMIKDNVCRCKLETQCINENEYNKQHKAISGLTQTNIVSVLMYLVISKLGNYLTNTNDIYKCTPPKFNAEGFTKGSLAHLYTKLYEISKEEALVSVSVQMEILLHVLIAFHSIPSEKNIFASVIDVMLDMGCLSAAVKIKDMLLSLLQKEFDIFQKGSEYKLIFIDPEIHICFTTMGLCGVLKCLTNLISNVEYQILLREEQTSLMNMMISIQTYLGESTVWNNEYERLYLHCRQLQCTLEKKLGFHMSDIKLDSDSETANDNDADVHSHDKLITASPISSQTSRSVLHPGVKTSTDANESKVEDWTVDSINISKLRKVYAHEISTNAGEGKSGTNWISRWVSKMLSCFVTCGKCCESNPRA